jgi:hypothetical protein
VRAAARLRLCLCCRQLRQRCRQVQRQHPHQRSVKLQQEGPECRIATAAAAACLQCSTPPWVAGCRLLVLLLLLLHALLLHARHLLHV